MMTSLLRQMTFFHVFGLFLTRGPH